ncbi:uncharacterized, partial [Tachysurus ichikawai]
MDVASGFKMQSSDWRMSGSRCDNAKGLNVRGGSCELPAFDNRTCECCLSVTPRWRPAEDVGSPHTWRK